MVAKRVSIGPRNYYRLYRLRYACAYIQYSSSSIGQSDYFIQIFGTDFCHHLAAQRDGRSDKDDWLLTIFRYSRIPRTPRVFILQIDEFLPKPQKVRAVA